jgi:sodium-dependent dicarboxylate transporter 2/3/5
LARFLLLRFGARPAAILAGVMTVTFGFSAFMSNTATTVLMLALLAPLGATLRAEEPFKKALLLGTAVAANLGGMATLIGTPANAIAAGLLQNLPGQDISFLRWTAVALPLASAFSIFAWLLLLRAYSTQLERLDLDEAFRRADPGADPVPRWKRLIVMTTGIATVGLWMTSGWHSLPMAVVSLVPIVAFTTLFVLGPTDIRGLPWDVLFLLAGGLVLGDIVKNTGLANWLLSRLPVSALGPFGIALMMAYVCVVVSNFMSNTAAANVLLPLGVALASASQASAVAPIALAASAAMCLPIATPPNALVFATGHITTRDFLRIGVPMGLVVPLLAAQWCWLFLR